MCRGRMRLSRRGRRRVRGRGRSIMGQGGERPVLGLLLVATSHTAVRTSCGNRSHVVKSTVTNSDGHCSRPKVSLDGGNGRRSRGSSVRDEQEGGTQYTGSDNETRWRRETDRAGARDPVCAKEEMCCSAEARRSTVPHLASPSSAQGRVGRVLADRRTVASGGRMRRAAGRSASKGREDMSYSTDEST